MKEQLDSFLFVLAIGAAVAIAAKRLFVPYNVALVVVGLALVFMDVLPKTPMDPELVLLVFLPALVFQGALFADVGSLKSAAKPILALALPGVFITLLGTAAVATFALQLDFPTALLLGALLAITDTVSVLIAFRTVKVPHRLAAIMEGESLFNDGTALVLVALTTEVVTEGHFDPVATMRALSLAIGGGLVVGIAAGVLGAMVLRRTPDHLTAILASIVVVFATSAIAETLHASPVVAVVCAGIVVGVSTRRKLEPSRVLALQNFWETADFCLNVLLFLLVGMQLDARMLLAEAKSIGLALVALHAGRAVAVYGCFAVLRLFHVTKVPPRWQHVMVLGNIKGALSMAAVLALRADLPGRNRLVAIVFGVTFVTLVTQALPLRKILMALGVVGSAQADRIELARATLIEARRSQLELDELISAGLISRRDRAVRQAYYQRLVISAEEELRTHSHDESSHHHLVEWALASARKAALLDAARRGLVDLEVAERRVNELDRELVSLNTVVEET